MGSLSSRPKAPAVQKPIIIYQTAQSPTNSPTNQTKSAISSKTQLSKNQIKESQNPDNIFSKSAQSSKREENLLNRYRGRLGTVKTGFRGLLNSGKTIERKSLLGE